MGATKFLFVLGISCLVALSSCDHIPSVCFLNLLSLFVVSSFAHWYPVEAVLLCLVMICCLMNLKVSSQITVITILHHSGELNPWPFCFLGFSELSSEPVCCRLLCPRSSTAARPSIDGLPTGRSLKLRAYLINAGLAAIRHFITAFCEKSANQIGFGGGVNVIVIESDYPIISSNP